MKPLKIIFVLIIILLTGCQQAIKEKQNNENETITSYTAPELTDSLISEAIVRELKFRQEIPEYSIQVKTKDGIVSLTGETNNLLEKKLARDIAMAIKGVRGVINRINVTDTEFRTDAEIKNDVKHALLFDPATNLYDVDVAVDNGKVTLTGRVKSWQEKQLCETVTGGVLGVQEIENNIGFKKDVKVRADNKIEEEIEAILRWNVKIDHELIDVKVNDGEVMLEGTVGSAREKQLVIEKSWILGVSDVNDIYLKVDKWKRDPKMRMDKYKNISDNDIEKAIIEAYKYDPRISVFNPYISVKEGIVTLTDTVDNLKAKEAAAEVAQNIVGVLDVKNYLKVEPKKTPDDDKLAEKAKQTILRDPYLEKYEIRVKAYNGELYLTGVVDNHFENHRAENVLSKIKGVREIKNNIKIKNDDKFPYYNPYYGFLYSKNLHYMPETDIPPNSDLSIKEKIEREFWWSPFIREDQIDIKVENGKAILIGEVDSPNDKYEATLNAYEAGANVVDNRLIIRDN